MKRFWCQHGVLEQIPHRDGRKTIFNEAKLHYPQILNSKGKLYISSVGGNNSYLDVFSKF